MLLALTYKDIMTLFQVLQTAGLPVEIAEEDGTVSMGTMTDEQTQIFQDILLEYFQPAAHDEAQGHIVELTGFKDKYIETRDKLLQIESDVTNQTAVEAIKILARNQRFILKLLFRSIQ